MEAHNDWGVPDWESATLYPKFNMKSVVLWAWEFLRRNPQYRQFWKEKVFPYIEEHQDHLGQHSFIGKNTKGEFWPFQDEAKQSFGIDLPSAPHSQTPPHFLERQTVSYMGSGNYQLAEHERAYVINLHLPLDIQFKRAIKSARAEQKLVQKTFGRERSLNHYISYLRIIDGLDAGASPKSIATKLFPNQSDPKVTFNNRRSAAMGLRDGGYRLLIS
jgi:Family of unknown function (DUF6499)